MGLWLPPSVQDRLVDERQAADSEADRLVQHDIETAKRFTRDMQRIDPYLELVWIGKPPHWDDRVDPPPGIAFSRWHLRRNNPDAPDTYIPWTTPDGGYREPDSGIFDYLAANDMWNDGYNRRARVREARRAAEKARSQDRDRAERMQEFHERFKAKESPSVSMTSAGKWTYRAAARKG